MRQSTFLSLSLLAAPAAASYWNRDWSRDKTCGDPHIKGIRGQKFDFLGEEGKWYGLLSDPAAGVHLNIRTTAPFAEAQPDATWVTGLGAIVSDDEGEAHTIVIEAVDPHNYEAKCPDAGVPCLANGALRVLLDDEPMQRPGVVEMSGGVRVAAVNVPLECSGMVHKPLYKELTELSETHDGDRRLWRYGSHSYSHGDRNCADTGDSDDYGWRRLSGIPAQFLYHEMDLEEEEGEGVRVETDSDYMSPFETIEEFLLRGNKVIDAPKCEAIVSAGEQAHDLWDAQSDFTSFLIETPDLSIRVDMGKIRKPQVWKERKNLRVEDDFYFYRMDTSLSGYTPTEEARGVLGETAFIRLDESNAPIMDGEDVLEGTVEQYEVEGALGEQFEADQFAFDFVEDLHLVAGLEDEDEDAEEEEEEEDSEDFEEDEEEPDSMEGDEESSE